MRFKEFLTEERPAWQTMSNKELKVFQKKCKHEWKFDKELLQGTFFRCTKCGCEGKQSGKEVRRVFK